MLVPDCVRACVRVNVIMIVIVSAYVVVHARVQLMDEEFGSPSDRNLVAIPEERLRVSFRRETIMASVSHRMLSMMSVSSNDFSRMCS